MESGMIDLIFAVAGLALVVFAIVFRKHLSGQRVVDLTAEKLGVILKADAFGLVVLLGCMLVIAGMYFRYQHYEDKVNDAVNKKRSAETMLDQFLNNTKTYNLSLNLIFPVDDPPDTQNNPILKAFVQKKGESVARVLDHGILFSRGLGGLVANFEGLNHGDKLYVEVEGGNKKWRSDEVITPAAHLRMNSAK